VEQPGRASGGVPLGLELTLSLPGIDAREAGGGLWARLVRPGRSGWVAGGLRWARLDSAYSMEGEDRAAHLRLLRELYALYTSSAGAGSYY
jgi:hypothetical protein